MLRNIYVISIASIFFSIPLFLADKNSSKARTIEDLTYSDAISIGLWQCFAVIPGASRAGCCITGALIRGYTRMDSTHISFLFAAVIVLSSAATMRIIAWQIYDASFAPTFIIVEIVSTTMILFSIFLIKNKNSKTQDDEKDNS